MRLFSRSISVMYFVETACVQWGRGANDPKQHGSTLFHPAALPLCTPSRCSAAFTNLQESSSCQKELATWLLVAQETQNEDRNRQILFISVFVMGILYYW